MTVASYARDIGSGHLSPVALVDELLARLDPKLGAYDEATATRKLQGVRTGLAQFYGVRLI